MTSDKEFVLTKDERHQTFTAVKLRDGSVNLVSHELRWPDNPNQPYQSHTSPFRDRSLGEIPQSKIQEFITWLQS